MIDALRLGGARVIKASAPTEAPFRITFELPSGERHGIVAYAFTANTKKTRNRPDDEHRFQVKYGSDFRSDHEIWQDEYGLYTTLFLGINVDEGFFVAADPWQHRITRFSKSIEFKDEHVEEIKSRGWFAWERDRRAADDDPVSVLVGGVQESFLRLVLFEREAFGEDQGHRQWLAERSGSLLSERLWVPDGDAIVPPPTRLHALAGEFELSEDEVLDLIQGAPRLKMAVRGWVAEEHLVRSLQRLPGVTDAERLRDEGGPDVSLRFRGSRPLLIECKNVLRKRSAEGLARLDFQRTRASKADPCSRYYGPEEFDVVAACLHAVTERWEFQYVDPRSLDAHKKCDGKLSNLVRLDKRWSADPAVVLTGVAGG